MFNNTRRLVLVIVTTFVVTALSLTISAQPAAAHSIPPVADIFGSEVGGALRIETDDIDGNLVARVEPIQDTDSIMAKPIPPARLPMQVFKTVTSEATNFVIYSITTDRDQNGAKSVVTVPENLYDVLYQFVIKSIHYMLLRTAAMRY